MGPDKIYVASGSGTVNSAIKFSACCYNVFRPAKRACLLREPDQAANESQDAPCPLPARHSAEYRDDFAPMRLSGNRGAHHRAGGVSIHGPRLSPRRNGLPPGGDHHPPRIMAGFRSLAAGCGLPPYSIHHQSGQVLSRLQLCTGRCTAVWPGIGRHTRNGPCCGRRPAVNSDAARHAFAQCRDRRRDRRRRSAQTNRRYSRAEPKPQ